MPTCDHHQPHRYSGSVHSVQEVQGEFIQGVLAEEELGTKLHVHLAENCYAARVLNPRSYDAVSRCCLCRHGDAPSNCPCLLLVTCR